MKEIIVNSNQRGQRIDKFIRKYLNEAPLSFIYKLFRTKDVKVNGKRVDLAYKINENDKIQIYVTDAQLADFNKPKPVEKLKVSINIVYEDENILIINKPKGILIHGDSDEKRVTLANQVLNYLIGKGEYNPYEDIGFTPAPAHRLDRNTSGIVLFGKNIMALQSLLDLLKNKEQIEKEYYALVVGRIKKDGSIAASLLKDESTGLVKVVSSSQGGKTALTHYYVEKVFANYTLLRAKLVTGRTHQLRVHFKSIDHPIIGDGKYGSFSANREFEKKYNYKSQFLHAYSIRFTSDLEGFLSYLKGKTFIAPLGKKEREILNILSSKEE